MAAMTFTSKLLEKIQRLPDTSSFRFWRPPEYTFAAGQFFALTLMSPDGPPRALLQPCRFAYRAADRADYKDDRLPLQASARCALHRR